MPISIKTYLGLWADAGNVWLETSDAGFDDSICDGAVTALLETPVGPRHFGDGHADHGRDAFQVDFGIHPASPAKMMP